MSYFLQASELAVEVDQAPVHAWCSAQLAARSSTKSVDVCVFCLYQDKKLHLSGSGSSGGSGTTSSGGSGSGGPGVVANITEDCQVDEHGNWHGNWHLDGGHDVNLMVPRGRG